MASPRALTQMAFAAGLDESQQGEVLEPTKGFTRLENVRQDRRGALSKRPGFASLSTDRFSGSRSAGKKLLPLGRTLGVIDGTVLDVWSGDYSKSVQVGRVCEADVSLTQLPSDALGDSGRTPYVLDMAVVNGCVITVYSAVTSPPFANPSVIVSVTSLDGETLRQSEAVGSVANIFAGIGWYGTMALLFVSGAGSGTIEMYKLDTASATTINTGWAFVSNVATDKRTSGTYAPYALSVQSLTDRVAVAYVNTDLSNRVGVKTVDATGVLQSTTIATGGVVPDGVAIAGSQTGTLWVAWNETTNVKVIGLNPTTISSTTATVATLLTLTAADSGVAIEAGSAAGTGVVWCNDSGLFIRQRPFQTSAGAVSATAAQSTVYAAQLNSRVKLHGGRYYGVLTPHEDNAQSMHLLCDLTELTNRARPVGNVEPGLAIVAGDIFQKTRCHVEPASQKLYTTAQVRRTAKVSATFLVTYDFASSRRWQSVEYGGSAYMAGGVLTRFDGVRVAESGFLYAPSRPTVSDVPGTLSPAVGYRYIAVYELADGDGNWHVSGVSSPSASTGPLVTQDLVVQVGTYSLTYRSGAATPTQERISLYRTTDGGTLYYYNGSKANDTSGSIVTFNDSTTDAALVTNPFLYRPQGGLAGEEQDHRAPPGFQAVTAYNGMLAGIAGQSVWHSGSDVVGVGPWFNPVFRQDVQDGGDFVALWPQDGSLYLAKRDGIYVTSGEAPSGNGASGGLAIPRRLAVDCGCIDQRSVVTTALGTFFQSDRGIELLSRGQSVEWVGEPVQTTLASYPVIVSATLDQAHALVRFECVASETDNTVATTGVQLVYDLTLRTWVSVDKVTTTVNATRSAQHAAMAYVSGTLRYVRLDQNGTVFYERSSSDGSAHLDGSTWVTMLAETAWLKLGGIQGQHHVNRCQWLAQKSTRADYSLSLAYDYGGTYKAQATWSANAIDSLSTAIGRVQLEHTMHDEAEGVSVRVLLEDATPTGGTVGTGKGATWIALTFEGTPREGATALPEESR